MIDSDIEQFPDRFGRVDDLARKLTHGKNVAMSLDRTRQKINKTLARHIPRHFFPTGDGANILDEIRAKASLANGDDQTAYQIILDNLIVQRDTVFPTASEHYKTFWTRDAWLMEDYTESPALKEKTVAELGSWMRQAKPPYKGKQVPTEVSLNFLPPWGLIKYFRDDESNLIWSIMALECDWEEETQLEASQQFIDSHVDSRGNYISPAGTRRFIWDALNFPRPSRIAYVAGLYAYESYLAAKKGLRSFDTAHRAAESYKELASFTQAGFLPVSDTFKWMDQMAFYGEYLALLRGGSFLGPEIARNTREFMNHWQMRARGLGLMTEEGELPQSEHFIDPYQRERWFLPEHTFDSVCEIHGIIDHGYRQTARDALNRNRFAEYRNAPPQKDWHIWNVNILAQQRDTQNLLNL